MRLVNVGSGLVRYREVGQYQITFGDVHEVSCGRVMWVRYREFWQGWMMQGEN